MSLAPGSRVGDYQVVALLGAGGMGEVYRARDAKLSRDVAIKVLPAALGGDVERVNRFEREAQMLAALNHPNIAAIYGVETAIAGPDGTRGDALVMELVEGPTLAALLTQAGAPARGLPLTDVVAIARQLVDALDAAHERGIIHRDLKPANIKVRDDGTVKVLDFGLAKALAPDAGSASVDAMNSPTLTAPGTQLGVILGTAAYMSPEQARGRALDKRTDIWAFGAVLFEMLTGRRAFAGDDVTDTLAAVLRHDLDWQLLPPDTPSGLRRLLARCLDRDLKRRLRDIADAREDLDGTAGSAAAADGSSAIAAVPHASRARMPWTIAGLSIIVAAAIGGWAFLRTPVIAPGLVTRNEISMPDRAAFPSLSRDGTRLTYTWIGAGGEFKIGIRRIDQFGGAPVPGAAGVFPIFSPDGQWLAYTGYRPTPGISRIPISGGAPTFVCEGSTVYGAVWLSDDTIVFAGDHGLMRVRASGGTPEALTTVDTPHGEVAHGFPSALPDGQHLLFTVNTAAGKSFAVLDLASRKYRTVAPGGDRGQYVASGHLTFVRGTTLFAVPFDASRFVVTGAEVPVVEGVMTTGNDAPDYTVSDSGLLVYKRDQGDLSTLAWIDRKGAVTPLPGSSKDDWDWGRVSPDGTRLAISKGDHAEDVWVLDLARGAATKLTSTGHARVPVWMPDGRRIIFSDQHDGHPALWIVPADDSAPPTVLADFPSYVMANAVSPDGRTLFVVNFGTHPVQLMVVPLDANGRATAPARPWHEATTSEDNADISPDGRWVAYESQQSGDIDVYVQSSSGTGARVRVSEAGGHVPRWSHDGRELLWTSNFSTALEAADVTPGPIFAPGQPHVVLRDVTTGLWDVTPDPNRFLIAPTVADVPFAIVTNWFDELRRDVPPHR